MSTGTENRSGEQRMRKVEIYAARKVADAIVLARTAALAGGFTLVDTVGGWVEGDEVTVEPAVMVIVFVDDAQR